MHNNRALHNARVKKRRELQPEWYAKKEPEYYRRHRAKIDSIRPWAYLIQSARLRAKEKGWAFDLDDVWAQSKWTGACEITKLPFLAGQNPKGRGPGPFSPSVDRINSEMGYTKENTRFILWGVNAIKGGGTDEDMYLIAKAICKNKHIL